MVAPAIQEIKFNADWSTEDMDRIMDHGDKLYVASSKLYDVVFLLPSKIGQPVSIAGYKVDIEAQHSCSGSLSLDGNLPKALNYVNDTCFFYFVLSSYSIGVIKEKFDSHSYPGSVHEARVFRNNQIFEKMQTLQDFHPLGDSAYPLKMGSMTPYKDCGYLTNMEKKYNLYSFITTQQRATIKHGLPDSTVTRIISLEKLRRRETTRVLRATVTYSPNYLTDITPSPHFRTAALAGGCVYSPVITLSRITLTIEPTQTMPVSVCHFPPSPLHPNHSPFTRPAL
ncbi:hypothetical protein PoB_000889600 [Plakobranchus ocellatus]|uniref:DDE Tnp4 domain-containing protein n=1 Tax=Plakobranchus ocellatus TaxID=259542 RepID=A0AAV3YJ63_9GAST|nr:hypothetical protein PoB_000889600 [Plakobranchus ocellatus]